MPKRVEALSPPVVVSSTYRNGLSGDQSWAAGMVIVCRARFAIPGTGTGGVRGDSILDPPFSIEADRNAARGSWFKAAEMPLD